MLELRDLHCYYGRSHVVQGVSLQVRLGEAVGLVGHNGVGKTTTLRSVMGLGPQTRGWIGFEDRHLGGAPVHARARRGIGFVPEDEAVFSEMTVAENIRTGALLQPVADQARCLASAYELFPVLRERRDQMAGTLSGGEQKMLALARGLALQPRLIMVDEPSEGLMPINVGLVAQALKRAVLAGMGVLVVDASFHLLKTVCSRLYVMKHGVITGEHQLSDLRSPEQLVATYLKGED
jgi:branched-chain amino acid transport system ATP-binding protein